MSLRYTSLQENYGESGRTRKVAGANGIPQDRKQLLPVFQREGRVYQPTYRQLPSKFSSTMFNQASVVSDLIPKIDYIDHACLRIDITVSGAPVALVHTNYWFRQVDLKDSGSGVIIQTHYDDTVQANFLNRCPLSAEKALFKTANIESAANGKYGVTNLLPVGTHSFYMPLLTTIFENFGGLYLADLQGDLQLVLTTPSTIIASGAGTISTNISYLIEGANLTASDMAVYRNRYNMGAAEAQFLQPIVTQFNQVQLTAGASSNLKLDNVDGLCPFQMIMVRPVGLKNQNAGFAQWQLLNIGDSNGAAIDLVTNAGNSIWGNGQAVPTRYMRQHISVENFPNGWVSEKPVYFINHCEKINYALRGKVEGSRYFKSTDGDMIRLVLPSAPVQEVHTVTFSAVPLAAGNYSFTYKGEQSAQIAGNATPAVMQATLQAMKSFAARFITVTCSAAASAGISFTITFTDPEGELVGDLVQLISHDGIAASASTARTVAGVPGLASGQYDVVVYSYVFKVANYSGSKLTSRLLLN
jgi:hypothetical protein